MAFKGVKTMTVDVFDTLALSFVINDNILGKCFLYTLTFRALRGNHIVMVTLAVYPRLLRTTLTISVRFVFRHPNPSITNDLHDLPQWFTTFEIELRGYKQATALSHERTKNSNPSKKIIFATTQFEFESPN